jgi:hypothetical protein
LSSLNRGQRVIDTTAAIVEFGEITAMELADYLDITRYDLPGVRGLGRPNQTQRVGPPTKQHQQSNTMKQDEQFQLDADAIRASGNILTQQCHGQAKASGWWLNILSGRQLMVSAEALGAWIDKNEAEAKAMWQRSQV